MKNMLLSLILLSSFEATASSGKLNVYCGLNGQNSIQIALLKSGSYHSAQFEDLTIFVANEGDEYILLQSQEDDVQVEGKQSAGLFRGYGPTRKEIRCAFKKF